MTDAPADSANAATSGAERTSAFFAMERNHRLFDARYDGWSPWRVMRNPLQRTVNAVPLASPKRSTVARSMRALGQSLRFIAILIFAGRRDLLVKSSRTALRISEDGRFRDVYFDGLLKRGHSFFKIEDDNSPDFDRQARLALFPGDLDSVAFTFWGRVFGTIRPAAAMPFCTMVSDLLARECKTIVDPRWLLMRISTTHWQAWLYTLLLRRLRPKAVLVSDAGEYGLRLACARLGICFIELQHGVFAAVHPDAIPAWVQGSAGELLLPDHLAAYGQYWIDGLAGTRQGRDHAVAIGNELIDMARQKRLQRPRTDEIRIVVTSQGLDSARLAKWLDDMIAAAPRDIKWSMCLKLHPMYDHGNRSYERLADDARVTVQPGDQLPNTFDLLAEADWHLSIASACHFDAASLGVRSVIIPLSGHELVLPAVDGESILLAERPEDFWSFVASPDAKSDLGSRFTRTGFIDNIEELLASVGVQR